MTAPLKSIEGTSIAEAMAGIGRRAKARHAKLALSPATQRDAALAAMAKRSAPAKPGILAANAEDVAEAKAAGTNAAFLDRLTLTPKIVAAMATASTSCASLPIPVGAVTESWTRPNGMTIERVRVPLGVVGVIYESRPNVTADAAVLCLKGRKCRDPARRLGKLPLDARDPCGAGRGPARRDLPRTRSSSCRRATARRSG
jgi:glutamate-5-semialdehyde dehydrogenase